MLLNILLWKPIILRGESMAVIKANYNDIKMLARLIRAEAEGEGQLGMLMVGNVGVNRVRVGCLDFEDIRSIPRMVYQSPGGFEAVQKSYFYQRAREKDIRLAKKVVNGMKYHPAQRSLWFFDPGKSSCPATWYNQYNVGRYKAHCFYSPTTSNCPEA